MTSLISITLDELLINEDINDDYTCCVCECLLIEALQCRNGHVACKNCFIKIVKSKKECMTCRCEIKSIESLSKNRYLEKEIRKLNINCPNSFLKRELNLNNNNKNGNGNEGSSANEIEQPQQPQQQQPQELIKDINNGCKEILTIDQLDSHLKQCEYRFLKCTNLYANDLCSELDICGYDYRYNQSEKHRDECPYGIIGCTLCGKDCSRVDIESHTENHCPKLLVKCPTCNQDQLIARCDLDDHLSVDCAMIEIDCILKESGCKERVKRNQLANHLSSDNHLLFINNQFNQQNDIINQLKLELSHCNDLNEILTAKLDRYNNDNTMFRGKWVISNWTDKLNQYPPKKYLSLDFNLSQNKPFSIRVYPNGSSVMWHNCTISLVKLYQTESTIKFSFEIENEDPLKNDLQTKTDIFKGLNDSWSLQFFKVCDQANNNGFIINDTLTINFSIKIKKCFENIFITE
ncbi:hypothetical protein DDB_G0267754 [Dictyostelium discoideum AX4]|uniref:TNF receptor-associated factor family protein DDB_G0267754 n=1 Tax=Dictyostelium discoideum TaxID=44689 RepID=Y7754_DICDI|nr:hypothetical protein DDB_G0267754 [Dictyostelium discoideum AX4]Q55GA0.1 RecName: Full=TNF receptor-associated factor family protein DDB_G0267754 [Dictyostelium discoideum]EAL73330.1 hypothetical protein DDB_G0267754 [Dictyostelium discoideum AX4]|eukprot:XP_647284.1 hypothetical protein DDB_G0267754 [Dictyostelium discoideum AX4]